MNYGKLKMWKKKEKELSQGNDELTLNCNYIIYFMLSNIKILFQGILILSFMYVYQIVFFFRQK